MTDTPSNPKQDAELQNLLLTVQSSDDRTLAVRYTPEIRFDENEPFMPLVGGYTIFRADAPSLSYPRQVTLTRADAPAAQFAIEYAIWWDWDIGHLYELEHLWVYVGADGAVVGCEASWHGDFHDMAVDGSTTLHGEHPVVYSEPGKHAFAPRPSWFVECRTEKALLAECGRQAGLGGVWVTPLFEDELSSLRTPLNNTLVRTWLQRKQFTPALRYEKRFLLTREMLVPGDELLSWIPTRVQGIVEQLAADLPTEELHFLRIGHRGASAHAPENTLAAFRKAAKLGANAVELDLQMSADGVPVVIHDRTATRLGDDRAVGGMTYAQLQALDAGDGERIPTLDEALSCCVEELLLPYIEIKDGAAVPAVVAAIQAKGMQQFAVVGSFVPDWVAAVKQLDDSIATSILFGAVDIEPVQLARSLHADYVHPCWERAAPEPHRLLTREWVEKVRAAGLGIVLWHEERPSEIAQLRRKGVDGICSDAPDLLG